MEKPDRLSALLTRFELQASVLADPVDTAANMLLLGSPADGIIEQVWFWPIGSPVGGADETLRARVVTAATVSLGGEANPMARALPECMMMAVAPDSMVNDLAQLIGREAKAGRCGGYSTLQRLFEVLVILLLRHALEQEQRQPGLIAGLADDRLCRALVAIHEAPECPWRIETLAELAGLSRSQFMARFAEKVGQTPFGYLRQWRLMLARQDLAAGDRVKTVASRYGYGSQEALSRAYRQYFGQAPRDARSV
ncbi:MAG: helix-turn-helix transcriptional regulator [Oceanospirillaceae bacterium]|nr:helix-turn-helix transcriptional regulator [Oceanospirillaceae bacterium]